MSDEDAEDAVRKACAGVTSKERIIERLKLRHGYFEEIEIVRKINIPETEPLKFKICLKMPSGKTKTIC